MLKKIILCPLLATSMLSGCASSKPQLITPTIPDIDAALSAPCPPLQTPVDTAVDSLLDAYIDTVGKYGDCAKRHDATVKAWQHLKHTKE